MAEVESMQVTEEAPATVNKENTKAKMDASSASKPRSTQKSTKILSKCERMFLADKAKAERLAKQAEKAKDVKQKELSKAEKMALKDQKEQEAAAAKAKREADRAAKKAEKEAKALLPKKPMTAFFCFAAERRATLKEEKSELSVTEAAKKLGEEWKELTAEDKEKYEAMAAADKERYAAECKAAGIEPSAQKAKRAAAEEGEEGSAAPKKQKKEKKVEVEVVPAKDACHFFKVERRDSFAAEHVNASVNDLVERMVKAFEELDEEERRPYEAQAAADLERFERESATLKAAKAAEKAEKEAEKAEKAAQKKAEAAEKATQKKKQPKVKYQERKPTAEEKELLDKVEEIKKAGEDAAVELQGWKLRFRKRAEKDGKPAAVRGDIFITSPDGEKLTSVVLMKKKLGIMTEVEAKAAPAEAEGEEAPAEAEGEAMEEEEGAPEATEAEAEDEDADADEEAGDEEAPEAMEAEDAEEEASGDADGDEA